MGREVRTININITFETKSRLTDIKNAEETYNNVLEKLCYMEEKYNSKNSITNEYEISIQDTTRILKIDWKQNTYNIYYYDVFKHDWSNDIMVWFKDADPSIVEEIIDKFLYLMARDDVRALLVDLDDELVLNDLYVKRVVDG